MLTGELAKQAGVNLESVRFYERQGLLPCPPRTGSGYRSYDQRHLETIRFIKRSQALGFTLGEVRQLLQLHQRLASTTLPKKQSQDLELLQLTRERLHSIEEKIETLESMRKQLARFLRIYRSQKKLVCPAGK
jgi:MerR family mercuric resistance operon transcriptional regulator